MFLTDRMLCCGLIGFVCHVAVVQAGHCFDADGDADGCQKESGSATLSAPPPYGESDSLNADPSACPFYFVFDLTDDKQNGNTLTIPGANVYDCTVVTSCDVRGGGWSNGGNYQDFALATITSAGGGTWSDPATSTEYIFPERTDLGNRATIAAATLKGTALSVGTAVTVIGHPSGLPRKYTGGATVASISTCETSDTRCPSADASTDVAFAGYVADVDTFVRASSLALLMPFVSLTSSPDKSTGGQLGFRCFQRCWRNGWNFNIRGY